MATTNNAYSQKLSFPVAGDLSAFQFHPVTLTTAGLLTTIGSTATKPVGVLQDTPDTAGDMANVIVAGPSKMVVYTGTIAPMDALGVNANGVGEVTTTDNRWVIASALEATTDDGSSDGVISVLVNITRY